MSYKESYANRHKKKDKGKNYDIQVPDDDCCGCSGGGGDSGGGDGGGGGGGC